MEVFRKFDKKIQQEKETKENSKIYINVPYKLKLEAKKLGAKWDMQKNQWYVLSDSPNKDKLINSFEYKFERLNE
jgi:hypothetical protein